MKRQTSIFTLLVFLLLAACTTAQPGGQSSSQDASVIVKVFRPPS